MSRIGGPMDYKTVYLEQSYRDNWKLYEDTLHNLSTAPCWDLCIITASNEEQSAAYRIQLEHRRSIGLLPPRTKFMVIADPDGKRVGSGGATLNALAEVYKENGGPEKDNIFQGQKILIIHSGGDSKRLPQYSAFGKLFARVPHLLMDSRSSTLFDEYLVSMSGLPSRMKEGVVVVSGDVLLLFNHNQIDLGRQGAVGITIKTPVDIGKNHGVYVKDPASGRADYFLHKMDESILSQYGAVDHQGNVDIDTGVIWLDADLANEFLGFVLHDGAVSAELLARYVNDTVRLSLYGDFIYPLTEKATCPEYLQQASEGDDSPELLQIRQEIWPKINPYAIHIQSLAPAKFIHFGTTKEFRDLMNDSQVEYDYLRWRSNVLSYDCSTSDRDFSMINSAVLSHETVIVGPALIEDSCLKPPVIINRGAILSNVHIEKTPFEIHEDHVLHQLPVRTGENETSGYVTRIYGVHDNPKKSVADPSATFLNQPWAEWMKRAHVDPDDLWNGIPAEHRTLWNAMLYPLCTDREESLRSALLLQNSSEASSEEITAWRMQKRYSLEKSYQIAAHQMIIDQQIQIEDRVRVNLFIQRITDGMIAAEALKILGGQTNEIKRRVELLEKIIPDVADHLTRMHLFRVLAETMVAAGFWSNYEDRAFDELNEYIQKHTVRFQESDGVIKKHECRVAAAARINFGGGWSDTPPYCLEKGGTVLNTAITLQGKLPIQVVVKKLPEPVLCIKSVDLGVSRELTSIDEILDFKNPSDPLALQKAALVLAGLIKPVSKDLRQQLIDCGGGIELTTDIDIPKGSGLGTSSILAGALIQGLYGLMGRELGEKELFDRVFCLEQMMTTGGGWQDQVGGLTGGVKLISSKPGARQDLIIEKLALSEEFLQCLNERLILIFSGQRRLAKRILRDIMGEYLLNNQVIVDCLQDIQVLALKMRNALIKEKIGDFGLLLREHWEKSKMLDPNCTNPFIDLIFNLLDPYILGGNICGAGGGGFMFMILNEGVKKEDLVHLLAIEFHDSEVQIWNCAITEQALVVE